MAAAIMGYTSLNVCFESDNKLAPHSLLFKRHTLKQDDSRTPSNKTLFILNIPPYCTDQGLRNLFDRCGLIDAVYIQSQPGSVLDEPTHSINETLVSGYTNKERRGFGVAYVVFKTAAAVDKALSMNDSEIHFFSTPEYPLLTGLEKWCQIYKKRYPDKKLLQNEVDKYMDEFDKKEKDVEEENLLKNEPDDEGWVTVSHGGRKPGISQNKAITNSNIKKQNKDKELLNFYQFQQREKHRDNIAKLRKKFEEDKKRIAVMRTERKFKPYF